MTTLKLKPYTQLIAGKQTPCYAIFNGDSVLRTVSVFEYDDALKNVRRANAVLAQREREAEERAKRIKAGKAALQICSRLTVSRNRLTQKTIIAANKARALNN